MPQGLYSSCCFSFPDMTIIVAFRAMCLLKVRRSATARIVQLGSPESLKGKENHLEEKMVLNFSACNNSSGSILIRDTSSKKTVCLRRFELVLFFLLHCLNLSNSASVPFLPVCLLPDEKGGAVKVLVAGGASSQALYEIRSLPQSCPALFSFTRQKF